jgi:23S rRNA (adenine2503-C2)-methyltransferase
MFELHGHPQSEFTRRIQDWGFTTGQAARLWRYLYREFATAAGECVELSGRFRQHLERHAVFSQMLAVHVAEAPDGLARKYLLTLADGERIESVWMRFRDRATVCVSTQAGCALGCVFCATGQLGYRRDLTAGEIVGQALFMRRCESIGSGHPPLRNVVFMGMGEPLVNYDAVIAAARIFADPAGLALGAKQLTISTVGVIPGIVRLADERQPYSLAVSLHAATQAERQVVVPTARAWPLDELIAACRYYCDKLDRKIFFEWTMIDGVNDSEEQALAVVELLSGLPAHVNIIPLNPTAAFDGRGSARSGLERFRETLLQRGLPCTIRQRRGIEVGGGCGQLNPLVR